MNILLSSSGFFPNFIGGGEMYVYRLAKELLQRGHDVKVLTPVKWKDSKDPYIINKYDYENIPCVGFSLNPEAVSIAERNIGFGPLTLTILRGILSDHNPDIVHINGVKPAMVMLCNELKIPHVVTAHHVGISCPAGGLLRPDNSLCDIAVNSRDCIRCCSTWKRPKWFVGWAMGHIPPWIYRPLGKSYNNSKNLSYILRGLIYPWLIEQTIAAEKIVLEHAQVIIAPSLTIRDLLIRNGCDPQKIVVIPHGIVPIKSFPLGDIKNRPVRFGYIGRIDPLKGLHIMLEAAELLPDGSLCELHIFGAARNPWHEEYKKNILHKYRGKAKVFDHGIIQHDRLSEAFAIIDVLIVPSLLPEAFGLVVAESFSAGRPVVVFNSGALTEQVRHGIDGFVLGRKDSRVLAEAMEKIIDEPKIITGMIENIPDVRTVKEYVDYVDTFYRELIVGSGNL